MGELLESLHRLQALELKLATIRNERESKVRRLDGCCKRLKQIEDRIAAHEKTIRERQVQLDTLSLEVSSREESVAQHRGALTKAKTNREYAAILTAMNTEKADNMKMENDVLQRMDEVHRLKGELAEMANELEKFRGDVERAEQAVAAFDDDRREERTRLESQRDEHAQHVEPTAMAAFTRVARKNDGEAMATITKAHPKREEYVCEGCNMRVSLEIVSALQSRDEIQFCQVCGRILYLALGTPQKART